MRLDPKDPSFLGALIYFHHAADALSFSNAAVALNVTPSAVSHRITALETAMGKRLFERRVREVCLTRDGIELAEATAQIWQELQALTKKITLQEVLRVSVGPYLSSQWLLPRIGKFEAEHPELRVDLLHLIGEPDARFADVSIIWSELEHLKTGSHPLFSTMSIPVAAPNLKLGQKFWDSLITPIHYRDRNAWRHWLAAVGAPVKFADRGEILEEPHLVLEAAACGRGVAIGFLPFIGRYFEQKRLVPASFDTVQSDRGYRLVVNTSGASKCDVFAKWLLGQAESETMPAATDRCLDLIQK
ncbi:LysR family transcriptional regulator [Cochlodiniinecator piscidefendens]|uniref:LysR family transcriptional regulator n=1 Tax=Cochlodiniinecator piscidefendens TaxID=2715756 RepID=UPI00140A21A5|nr:LysR family transcriptional regulator [Cochlodiniinecator piscidefendens]